MGRGIVEPGGAAHIVQVRRGGDGNVGGGSCGCGGGCGAGGGGGGGDAEGNM